MQEELLKKKLTMELEDLYYITRKEIPTYNPTYFLRLVKEKGGFDTVKTLIQPGKVPDGLTNLFVYKRPDLSVEWFILNANNGEYRRLFSAEIINECKRRLKL